MTSQSMKLKTHAANHATHITRPMANESTEGSFYDTESLKIM